MTLKVMYIVIVMVIVTYKKYPKINKILNVWGQTKVGKHVFLKKKEKKSKTAY